jgi:predicted nucleic acid-binding protein
MNRTPPFVGGLLSPPKLVLDTAIPLTWALPVRRVGYAENVMFLLPRTAVAVSGLWVTDVVTVLRSAESDGALPSSHADFFLKWISGFTIRVDSRLPEHVWNEVLSLSRRLGISISDAAHLELAQRLALPLATIDPVLLQAANAAGIPLFTP